MRSLKAYALKAWPTFRPILKVAGVVLLAVFCVVVLLPLALIGLGLTAHGKGLMRDRGWKG